MPRGISDAWRKPCFIRLRFTFSRFIWNVTSDRPQSRVSRSRHEKRNGTTTSSPRHRVASLRDVRCGSFFFLCYAEQITWSFLVLLSHRLTSYDSISASFILLYSSFLRGTFDKGSLNVTIQGRKHRNVANKKEGNIFVSLLLAI